MVSSKKWTKITSSDVFECKICDISYIGVTCFLTLLIITLSELSFVSETVLQIILENFTAIGVLSVQR